MIVYYRICGVRSTNPSPIFDDNKFKQNELGLRSFVAAFKNVKPTVHFILDYCDQRYVDMLKRIVPFHYTYEATQLGINETCLRQYQLFEEQADDEVLFQECDYLWLPDSGQALLDALRVLPFVSPYDHGDKYLVDEKVYVKLVGDKHWKSTTSTTATFATTRKHFMDNKEIFYKHGYLDKARWEEIDIYAKSLYTPIPALATHMVKDWLSPGIDWKTEWEKYI